MGYVGQPIERIEDLRLLRGRGQYVDDLHREGMLHAAILRSTIPHGLIKAINSRNARAMPGVHAIFTAADIAKDGGPVDRKSTRLNSSHIQKSRMPSSA